MNELDTPPADVETPSAPAPEAIETATPKAGPWSADSERTAEPLSDDPPPEAAAAPVEAAAEAVVTEPEKRKKPRDNPESRIKDATAKEARAKEDARLAREEASQLRARLADLERPKPQAVAAIPNQGEPDFEKDFESKVGTDGGYPTYGGAVQAFNRAFAKWSGEQQQQAFQQTLEQREQRVRNDTRLNSHLERVAATKTAEPDFEQSLADWDAALVQAGVPVDREGQASLPPVITEAILDSQKGPQIMRWLGTHPQDAAQLVREALNTPIAAVPVMRRYLESQTLSAVARPDSASVVRPSAAKPPINRVGGTANATPVSPDDLEFGPEYMRAMETQDKKRAGGGRW